MDIPQMAQAGRIFTLNNICTTRMGDIIGVKFYLRKTRVKETWSKLRT